MSKPSPSVDILEKLLTAAILTSSRVTATPCAMYVLCWSTSVVLDGWPVRLVNTQQKRGTVSRL